MKVHESLAQGILDAGTPVVFGLLGDANLFIMDSYEKAGGRYVAFAHESGAVLAAVGYAQRSGGLAVATVTHGPALSNTVTALIERVKSQARYSSSQATRPSRTSRTSRTSRSARSC